MLLDDFGRPVKIDTCYAFAGHREIVKRRWPQFHVAQAAKPDPDA
jgi:hypothetical protein